MRRSLAVFAEFLFPDRGPDRGVPNLDGGLTPNDLLQDAEALPLADGVVPEDVVVRADGTTFVSAGSSVLKVTAGSQVVEPCATLPGTGRGLALRSDGSLLVCVDGAGLLAVDQAGSVSTVASDDSVGVLSAVAVLGDRVFVTEVSRQLAWDEWPKALYGTDATGRVLEVVDGRFVQVVDGLRWPYGLTAGSRDGALLVSESFRYRISEVDVDRKALTVVTGRLGAYPARLHRTDHGTTWVAFFGTRTHLIELVLREDAYRAKMMAQVPVDEWILPALRRTGSVREPLQVGGIKHLGEVKPWSPARAYGLVAEMDDRGDFLRSLHSRPQGDRHGVTAAFGSGDDLVAASTGLGAVLTTKLSTEGK